MSSITLIKVENDEAHLVFEYNMDGHHAIFHKKSKMNMLLSMLCIYSGEMIFNMCSDDKQYTYNCKHNNGRVYLVLTKIGKKDFLADVTDDCIRIVDAVKKMGYNPTEYDPNCDL